VVVGVASARSVSVGMALATHAVLRIAVIAPVATLLLTGFPTPAWAQSIDEYLNIAIPGTDVQPGVTVASRLRPEYEYPGLRLGGFIFHSELTESAGYESNVAATQPSQGSPFLDTAATVSANSDWGSDSLGATVSVDNSLYTALPRQDHTDWTAAINGSHDFGLDTATIGYAHFNLNQTPGDLGVPELDSPIAYQVDTVRLSYKAQFGLSSLTPALEVTNYSYENGTVQGVPYNQTFRNRVVITPSVVGSYALDSLRSIVVVARYANANYTDAQPGSPSLNFNDVALLGGINYDTGSLVRLRLLVGFESRFFQSSVYKTINAPIVEGSAVWTPTGLTTVTARVSRFIVDATSENSSGYTATSVNLAVDHEYLPNVLLNGSVGAFTDSYAQGGTQSYVTVGAGVTWLLTQHLRLGLRYDFTARLSPGSTSTTGGFGNGTIYGNSYSDNRFLLQLKIGF
jgi:hypothetical protein